MKTQIKNSQSKTPIPTSGLNSLTSYSPIFMSPQIQTTQGSIHDKASDLARHFKGKYLKDTTSHSKSKSSLRFTCQNGHVFMKTVESVSKFDSDFPDQDWCHKCKKFFTNCQVFAAKNDILILEGLYEPKITLMCQR